MYSRISLLILTIMCLMLTGRLSGQVGIGTTTPAASSGLDVDYTDKGFLPPRMTTAQRNAILSPADGLMIFNTTTGNLNFYKNDSWYELTGTISPSGTIVVLDCAGATLQGTLTQGITASGVTVSVPYTGGNGQYHTGQTVNSTGVTGLTALLDPGVFETGDGILTYTITGTPATSGTASFALNIGEQTCILEIPVAEGSFNCDANTVTFTYNGSTVTYGTVVSADSRCWLDRNLGATQVATSSDDSASFGHLFQWGRLDDGHQVRTSPTTTILSNSDEPGHGNFIKLNTSPYDWRSPQNNDLWQGEGGINNPCPDGYRLPTQAEWDLERLSWSSNNAEGAFFSPLKLPLAGYRDLFSGSVDYEGSYGFYWSSTVNNTNSWYLAFSSGIANMYNLHRARGSSVRCIKG